MGKAGLGNDRRFPLGHGKFEVSVRHPMGRSSMQLNT